MQGKREALNLRGSDLVSSPKGRVDLASSSTTLEEYLRSRIWLKAKASSSESFLNVQVLQRIQRCLLREVAHASKIKESENENSAVLLAKI